MYYWNTGCELIFIDESSSHAWHTSNVRTWMRPDDKIKFYLRNTRGKSVSIQGAISNKSPKFVWATSRKNNAESFMAFINNKIAKWPSRPKKRILILDNATWHRTKQVKDRIHALGFGILFLPTSSSELNPIGNFFCFILLYKKFFFHRNVLGNL